MTEAACERWKDLSNQRALEEALSAADDRFLAVHAQRCESCAAEAALFGSLSGLLDGDVDSQQPVQMTPRRGRRVSLHARRVGLIGGGLLVAAVTALAVVSGQDEELPDEKQASATRTAPVVSVTLVSGKVDVSAAQASAGAVLRPNDEMVAHEGRACVSYSGSISACTEEHTRLTLLSETGQSSRLRLDSGKVVCRLEKQVEGRSFAVLTPRGSVVATGTTFAVEHLANDDVVVRLHEGTVVLRTVYGAFLQVSAPAEVLLGEKLQERTPSQDEWDKDLATMSVADLWKEGAWAPLDVSPQGDVPTEVRLDGMVLGEAPVSMLVSRGNHNLVVSAAGYSSHRETIVVKGAERVTSRPRLLPEAQDQAPAGKSALSSAAMLSVAQELRGRGDAAGAARAYQGLLGAYPRSTEARAGLMSLGELQLSALGRPGDALRSFDRYLALGGSLAQEARYGRIRALRALGRAREAEDASVEFRQLYPQSPQATSLRNHKSVP